MNKPPSLRFRYLWNVICVGLLIAGGAVAQALTVEEKVTADYVKAHPEQFSVHVVEGKEGLLNFTVNMRLTEPMYLVSHLSVLHAGKIVAKSDTPLFGQKNDNVFHFSILRSNVAEAKFIIGKSSFGMSGDDRFPLPGSIQYDFALQDFVPQSPDRIE